MVKNLSAVSTESVRKSDPVGDTSASTLFPEKDWNNITLKLRILQNAIHEYQKAGGKLTMIPIKEPDIFVGVILSGVDIVGSNLVLVVGSEKSANNKGG